MPRRPVALVLALSAALAGTAGTASAAPEPGTGTEPAPPTAPGLDQRALDPTGILRQVLVALDSQARGHSRPTPGQGWRPLTAVADGRGTTHVRLGRTYRGLPVVGGDVVVHRDTAGRITGVDQSLQQRLTLGTKPAVPADRARTVVQDGLDAGQQTAATAPALTVDATGTAPRLVWEVASSGFRPDGTPSRRRTYVDATTGAVVRAQEQVQTVDGLGRSLYGGWVRVPTRWNGKAFALVDARRGLASIGDARGAEDLCPEGAFSCTIATSPTMTDRDNVWGSGRTGDRATAAVDVAYGSRLTWDYLRARFGRVGVLGDGKGLHSRVHYGKGYANAFWDGERMTYGDGDGTELGPLVSLDIVAHEMTHAVTESTAGLEYWGEAGGLNEATSDIIGTMVELSARNPHQPGNYVIGEKVDLRSGTGLRRMDRPSSDGLSADCWSPAVRDMDVHYSSGVGNHFFYLLAEGSGTKRINGRVHSSSTCDGSRVTGIGRTAAARIWYRGLTTYMTSATDYAGARRATLKAAADLYGPRSAQYRAVGAAWSAVKVG